MAIDYEAENVRLRAALDAIGRAAVGCWMEMHGQHGDDRHRRQHEVMAGIAEIAAAALRPPEE